MYCSGFIFIFCSSGESDQVSSQSKMPKASASWAEKANSMTGRRYEQGHSTEAISKGKAHPHASLLAATIIFSFISSSY